VKACFNTHKLPHRTTRLWAHTFVVVLYLALHNSHLLWRYRARDGQTRAARTKAEFINGLVRQLRVLPATTCLMPVPASSMR